MKVIGDQDHFKDDKDIIIAAVMIIEFVKLIDTTIDLITIDLITIDLIKEKINFIGRRNIRE